jgi:signal transduction histidine kinase
VLRVSTQFRLYALLMLLVAGFGATLGYLWLTQEREAARMLDGLEQERRALVDRVVELRGDSLRNFAHDYSYWDEMLAFVGSGDPAWARVNLDASLENFQAHGVWVLRRDGGQVHGAVRGLDPALGTLPLSFEAMRGRLERDRFLHFHLPVHGGLLELRAAPIQPSSDIRRATEPRGWLVVGRLWDDGHHRRLGEVLGGATRLHPPGIGHPPNPSKGEELHIITEVPLPGLDGAPVAVLDVDYEPVPLAVLLADNRTDKILFASFGALLLLAGTAAIYGWIVRPLRRLEAGLATRSTAALGDLPTKTDVFGRLATLAAESFDRHQSLEGEIEERRRAEAALRLSEETLRQSAELRTRLARDLHDGVIQSIYAAGLGLAGLRNSLRDEPQVAERRLDAAIASLNQTIGEVRSFINGLEPEGGPRPDFRGALGALASTLRALNPAAIEVAIAPGVPPLSPREEVHALQIVRECVSNAMRHGQAGRIEVVLRAEDGRPVLRIRDDGRGFDPRATVRGSGLANIAGRAAEIGATLVVDAAPGKGADIRVEFVPR